MILFAATTEYQEILPTTIRATQGEAVEAACALLGVKTIDELLKTGTCIAKFEYPSRWIPPLNIAVAHDTVRTYVLGFRASETVPAPETTVPEGVPSSLSRDIP